MFLAQSLFALIDKPVFIRRWPALTDGRMACGKSGSGCDKLISVRQTGGGNRGFGNETPTAGIVDGSDVMLLTTVVLTSLVG